MREKIDTELGCQRMARRFATLVRCYYLKGAEEECHEDRKGNEQGVMWRGLLVLTLASHAIAQNCLQPPAGLVGWWPGDGNANDIQDGNNGTLMVCRCASGPIQEGKQPCMGNCTLGEKH
jgi:hypothetical protein